MLGTRDAISIRGACRFPLIRSQSWMESRKHDVARLYHTSLDMPSSPFILMENQTSSLARHVADTQTLRSGFLQYSYSVVVQQQGPANERLYEVHQYSTPYALRRLANDPVNG